ncbi:hypothetical protein, partial [Subtercola lobariae]|uniref:hypothetical protein n=1 Tax=Subtercola lobariae TaxID=1588641 RepID=UPI001E609B50
SSTESNTNRIARSFNSGGYFFIAGMILTLSGDQEPPLNPGLDSTLLTHSNHSAVCWFVSR